MMVLMNGSEGVVHCIGGGGGDGGARGATRFPILVARIRVIVIVMLRGTRSSRGRGLLLREGGASPYFSAVVVIRSVLVFQPL